MEVRQWIASEFDDATARLRTQVFDQVAAERRFERPGGGSSIVWASFHIARHADLAMSLITGDDVVLRRGKNELGPNPDRGGGGIEEAEQPWSDELEPGAVDRYLAAVLAEGNRLIAGIRAEDLERVPDAPGGLRRAGVPTEGFEWLYRMWSDQPAAFFFRWPIIGHIGNHTGEMIATRNRMGLSPF